MQVLNSGLNNTEACFLLLSDELLRKAQASSLPSFVRKTMTSDELEEVLRQPDNI